MHLEHLLHALHMIFGLGKVLLEGLSEFGRGRLLDHGRESADDAFFGVIDVLELMDEQIVHSLDVFGEQAHGRDLRFELHDWRRNREWKFAFRALPGTDQAAMWFRLKTFANHRERWAQMSKGQQLPWRWVSRLKK